MLLPTTPSQTIRYDNKSLSRGPDHIDTLEAGSFLSVPLPHTAEPPEGWARFDHPEGNVYFAHMGTPRVVTDDDLLAPKLSGLLALWASIARERAKTIGVTLSASSELYLHLDGSDDCFYYFVDHASQVVFWVESVPIEDINFELPTASSSHLQLGIKELYWLHVEQFPSHSVPLMALGMNELIQYYIYAQADTLTSTDSTTIFEPEQYGKFIALLQLARSTGNTDSSSTRWFVARQWGTYYRMMFFNRSRETGCRLTRSQHILETRKVSMKWWFYTISLFLFRVPEFLEERLANMWHDDMVHQKDWKPFITAILRDWGKSRITCFGVLVLNILAQQTYHHDLSLVSMVTCLIGTISATLLITTHEGFEDKESQMREASQYLLKAYKPNTGFQVRAVLHSLPRAMAFWSITLTTLDMFIWILGEITGLHERLLYFLVLAVVTSVLCYWTVAWGVGAILQLFRRERLGRKDIEAGDM